MDVIVNEMKDNKLEREIIGKWVNYIIDIIFPYIRDLEVTEDVATIKHLNKKLGKHDFFKIIPMDSMIFNIIFLDSKEDISGIDINFNPYWTSISGNDKGNSYINDVEFDIEIIDRDNMEINDIFIYLETLLTKEVLKVHNWFIKQIEV
jgi:hypothetical protein